MITGKEEQCLGGIHSVWGSGLCSPSSMLPSAARSSGRLLLSDCHGDLTAMPRSVAEWIGKTENTPIPPRVRLRVFERNQGLCQCGCEMVIFAGDKWETDHLVALINGGENRESNLRTLLAKHHKTKSAEDVALKAMVTRKRMSHLGIKRRKGPPMAGSRGSKFKKRVDGTVVPR